MSLDGEKGRQTIETWEDDNLEECGFSNYARDARGEEEVKAS